MLSVSDIAAFPELGLTTAGGAAGLDREVSWLHVSELPDPTEWLEGGEFLLTTGIGLGKTAGAQRKYVRRLADHGLAGLGFGVGFGFGEVPRSVVEEADRLGFPVLSVPYEVPFVAITKTALRRLANRRLEQLTDALEVHERLIAAIIERRGLRRLLAIVGSHLECSLALEDEQGRLLAESHSGPHRSFEDALEVPVVLGDERLTLRVSRNGTRFGDYERLVLHHGQTALALELSLRHAVSEAELRLAGDLLNDLESHRLDERETAHRFAAFGLRAEGRYAALLAVPRNGSSGERLRREMADELERHAVRYLSTARPDRAAFLVEAEDEQQVLALAHDVLAREPHARIGVGRPARGTALSQSLLEAKTALNVNADGVASYRDLGSLELLLGLPDEALTAYVAGVLGPAADNAPLLDSLRGLLEAGCRWSEAAERLGVHRHTLRYRMDRLRDLTGRHPDEPAERMDLWLAVKASDALAARNEEVVQ
jgi:PucR family transcriptional regulator, purine catabolism regulatory protein